MLTDDRFPIGLETSPVKRRSIRCDTSSNVSMFIYYVCSCYACSGAAGGIGTLNNMEETQQTAWATHSKTCFGSDVSKWSAANVKAAGSVIGKGSRN